MKSKANLTLLLLFLISYSTFTQINANRKKITIKRVKNSPKIDGDLSDSVWQAIPEMKDFVEQRPDNGKPELKEYRTEVKMCYDDNAVYIAAMLYDPKPKSIPIQFSTRDNLGLSDFFYIKINPNDDGQNPYLFVVQATGNQIDGKVSSGRTDTDWSAVWNSKVKITDKGWIIEMKLPYSALRFDNKKEQSWGVNFHRQIYSINKRYTWNHIDNKQGIWTQYDGLVSGINNVKPPMRLALFPYSSASVTKFDKDKAEFDKSFGLDLKYGVSENFTLDATLIPDFGQTAADDVALNLGPLEQKYTEQRQFFTEGTELFNKGGLFYSRAVGGTKPIRYGLAKNSITNDEEITENSEATKLINALKFSGRTKNGWGIGIFNAITDREYAKIRNKVTNKPRNFMTQSLTNYNILVVDKQFRGNSSVSLTNTNVFREGDFKDANATALAYHLEDKKSLYFINGSLKMSHLTTVQNNNGYYFDTTIGKKAGNWQGALGYNFSDKNYNINDLGYTGFTDIGDIYWEASYRILKPTNAMNSFYMGLSSNNEFLHHSHKYKGSKFKLENRLETKNRFYSYNYIKVDTAQDDYFEPRHSTLEEIFFYRHPVVKIYHSGETDYLKKFTFDYNFNLGKSINIDRLVYGWKIAPAYRFSNKFKLGYEFSYNQKSHDRGWVNQNIVNDIIFGIRDRDDFKNILSGKYNFGVKSALSLAFLHNWTKVKYHEFHKLNNLGDFDSTTFNENKDIDYNDWNIDLSYQWQFAPGSTLTAFYRNTITDNKYETNDNLFENLNYVLSRPMKNTFSLKLVYYLDYNEISGLF